MTIPFERTRALVLTKEFLQALMDPRQTPRVPRSVRDWAKGLLRHCPSLSNIEIVHKALPDWYGPVPPFSRAHGNTAITGFGLDTLSNDERELEPITPEQHAVIAAAAPARGGRVVSSLLPTGEPTKCEVCVFEHWQDPDGRIIRKLTCTVCGASSVEEDMLSTRERRK